MCEFDSLPLSLNIIRYRQESGLNQKQLADKIGISRHTLSQYERNVKTPSINSLEKIADELNITVDDLIANNPNFKKDKALQLNTYLMKVSSENKVKILNILNCLIDKFYTNE